MPNLVLVSLDCVRPESVGCYGERFPSLLHPGKPLLHFRGSRLVRPLADPLLDRAAGLLVRPRTPVINALCARGERYRMAIAQAPYTPASHASMLTGQNPYRHGIERFVGCKLAPEAGTLAEHLQEAGFRTGAFVGANALSDVFGLDRGFDTYDCDMEEEGVVMGDFALHRRSCEAVTRRALDWLEGAGPSRPFFLFLHYFDAHERDDHYSYQPLFQIRRTTDLDRSLGRLVAALERRGQLADTLFMITADHGNDFGVHEAGHRCFLYDSTLRVPLVIAGPGSHPGTVVDEQVRLIDLMPTALERLGLPTLPLEGRLPLEGIGLDHRDADRPAYSETFFERSADDWQTPRHSYMSLRRPPWKLVVDRTTDTARLYDLDADPMETTDLGERHPEVVARMRAELDDMRGSGGDGGGNGTGGEEAMDDAERERLVASLKNLGYL